MIKVDEIGNLVRLLSVKCGPELHIYMYSAKNLVDIWGIGVLVVAEK